MGHSDSIQLTSLCGQCVSHTPSVLEGTPASLLIAAVVAVFSCHLNKATTLLLVIYGLKLRVFFCLVAHILLSCI